MEKEEAKGKPIHSTISKSNMAKSENLKRKLQTSLTENMDSKLPHTLGNMSRYNIRLPNWRGKPEEFRSFIRKLLLDEVMQEDLDQLHIINFCRTVQKLHPLKTAGDGNCLLHAVSMAIWGIHDKAMLLRRLLYIALVQDEDTQGFCRRWEKERKRLDEVLPGGLDLTSGQWATEWRMVVKAAEDVRSSNPREGDLPFEPLEEIHILVLANVIQRPILVLSHSRVQGTQSPDMGFNNFGGIYLPILWKPSDCCKTPVVLGYHMGHFTPLVHMNPSQSEHHIVGEYAVPLVTADLISLPIHFLFDAEEKAADELLQKYLHLTEINWTRETTVQMILSAKLDHNKIDSNYDLMTDYTSELERKFYNRQSSSEAAVGQPHQESNVQDLPKSPDHEKHERTSIEAHRKPSKHSAIDPNLTRVTKWVSELNTGTKPEPITTPSVSARHCRTPGCNFYRSVEYGEFCYQCFMKSTVHAVEKKPSPPKEEYEPSMTQHRCEARHCKNMASVYTYPFCHEHEQKTQERCHHLSCVKMSSRHTYPYCYEHHERQREPVMPVLEQRHREPAMPVLQQRHREPAMPVLEQERVREATPGSMYIPSITDIGCKHAGCAHVASTHTYPYCHQHKHDKDSWNLASTAIAKPHIAGQTQYSTTWYECNYPGCFNIASTNTFPYCHQHLPQPSQVGGVPAERIHGNLYTSHQVSEAREEYIPPRGRNMCSYSSCNNLASYETIPMCREHHVLQLAAAASHQHHRHRRQTSSLYDCDEMEPPAFEDCDRCHSLDNYKVGKSQPCREAGCPLYGPPVNHFYCPEHYVLRHKSTCTSPNKSLCPTPSCTGTAKSEFSGLCSTCFVLVGLSEELEPTPAFEDVSDDRKRPEGRPVMVSTSETGCIGPDCRNPADLQLGGLCEDCYNLLKHKKEEKSQQSFDAQTRLPCVKEGCDQPGKAECNYYCQQCYKKQLLRGGIAGSSPTRAQPSSPRRLVLDPPVSGCCSHRSHSPDAEVFFTNTNTLGKYISTKDRPDQLKHDGFPGHHDDRRSSEESAARDSRRCKFSKCKNFGNSQKCGFCNSCAARIITSVDYKY